MLDYRAYRLRLLLFFFPETTLVFVAMFGLPILNYSVGVMLFDHRTLQIVTSLVIILPVEALWLTVIWGILPKLWESIFWFFVDVIPAEGRSKEEARSVAWGGDKAIREFEIARSPVEWSDKLIHDYPKADWVQNLFYASNVRKRLNLIRSYAWEKYYSDPTVKPAFSASEIEKLLDENGLKRGYVESVVTVPAWRTTITSYGLIVLLLIFHPLG